MSEQKKYEFGDPVSIFLNGSWRPGHYVEANGDPDVPHRVVLRNNGKTAFLDRQDDEVTPLAGGVAVAPARGWRLPEPGDVVRADGIDHDVTLRNVAFLAMFAECEDDCGIHGADPRLIRVVRLHDAPAEAPAPEPAKPKGSPLIRAAFKMLDAMDECAKARFDAASDSAETLDAMAEQKMLEIVRGAMERATLAGRAK